MLFSFICGGIYGGIFICWSQDFIFNNFTFSSKSMLSEHFNQFQIMKKPTILLSIPIYISTACVIRISFKVCRSTRYNVQRCLVPTVVVWGISVVPMDALLVNALSHQVGKFNGMNLVTCVSKLKVVSGIPGELI